MRGPNATYLPGIDHQRAFAATLIVFYHGAHLISQQRLYGNIDLRRWIHATNLFSALVIEGHTAVALFMTLSGFIFTTASLDKRLRYSQFIRNRFLRIFPLFLAIFAVGFYGLAPKANFGSIAESLLLVATNSGGVEAPPFTDMFWTITVEFQFYLVFPFLLEFLQRGGPLSLFKVALFFALMRVAAVLVGANGRDLTYFSIVGRIDQFCIGMCFAWAYLRRRSWFGYPAVQLAASGTGMLLLLFALNSVGGWPVVAIWRVAFHSVEAMLWGHVIVCYLLLSERIPRVVSRMLCYVGSVSYSIYLLHFVVLTVILRQHWLVSIFADPMLDALANTLIVVLPATLLLSSVSYYAVELPFLNLRRPYLSGRPDEGTPSHGVEALARIA